MRLNGKIGDIMKSLDRRVRSLDKEPLFSLYYVFILKKFFLMFIFVRDTEREWGRGREREREGEREETQN